MERGIASFLGLSMRVSNCIRSVLVFVVLICRHRSIRSSAWNAPRASAPAPSIHCTSIRQGLSSLRVRST